MIIYKYGVELIRLERRHIEMLRQWRNSPEIAANMEFQQHITAEMQSMWFDKINNLHNFYFIIRHESTMLGLIHLAGLSEGVADSGIFIKHEDYINTKIPVMASLSLLDFAFYDLRLNSVTAKVKTTNERAYKYNKRLGFIYKKDFQNSGFVQLIVTKGTYLKTAGMMRDFALSLTGNQGRMIFDKEVRIDAEIAQYLNMKRELPLK